MNSIFYSLVTFVLFIAMVAAIVSFALHLIFFRNQKNGYRKLLLLGLCGECIGMISLFLFAHFYQEMHPGSAVPEYMVPFPFYGMLLGVFAGAIWLYRKSRTVSGKS